MARQACIVMCKKFCKFADTEFVDYYCVLTQYFGIMSSVRSIDTNRMRSYSSAFSRGAIMDIIRFNDFAHLSWVYNHYDNGIVGANSYLNYLKKLYKALVSDYRCEYVYKNEIVRKLLVKYGIKSTAVFNEFKVGNSIADIAFFNGESKAFEIKTDLDTPKRLEKQISDYQSIFDKCYIVIPADRYKQYLDGLAPEVGIITLSKQGTNIVLEEKRSAIKQESIDSDVLINCLRTEEYKSLIIRELGNLPDVPGHCMYDACRGLMHGIPAEKLKSFFIDTMKERKNNTALLKSIPLELRQLCLCLGLDKRGIEGLLSRLNTQIN